MGAWDSGSFGNDTALDFVADLKDFATLCSTLVAFEKEGGELDADDASVAIAACDLLAAAIGRPPADLPANLPADLPNLQGEKVSDRLLESAKAVVKRVREGSELAELWAEDDDAEWQAELDALLIRLTPSAPYEAPEKPEPQELPDDFLGHCYLCYEPVTERDGFLFEIEMAGGGTISIHPHRHCVEKLIPGPHWNKDGSPNEKTRKKLMQDMGFEQ